MHFVIFSGGEVNDGVFVQEALKSADKIIAADSGADSCMKFKIFPSVVLGDFDSIKEETRKILEEKGSEFIPFEKEKNETDTELAVDYAIKNGASSVSILGGVEGNRLDHVLGNLFFQSEKTKILFINGNQKTWLAKGPAEEKIEGKKGDLLSLIPIEDVLRITSTGLKYQLKEETLYFGKTRGISNEFLLGNIQIEFSKGLLLIVHTIK